MLAESSTCFPKRGLCKGFRVQQMKKQAPTGVSGWWSRISDFGTDERFGRLRFAYSRHLMVKVFFSA